VMVLWCWGKGEAEPLYLVSNMASAEEAISYYQKRFRVETFFPIRKATVSIFTSLIYPTRSVCLGY
jgi:hypothetical protein